MAVTVGGSVSINVSLSDSRTAVTGALRDAGSRAVAVAGAWALATGTGVGAADKIWGDTRTVTQGVTDIIDLNALLTNAFGSTETFVKVRLVAIVAASTNTTTLQIARPAAATGAPLFAAISDALAPLSAGGMFLWCDPNAGFTVTAATADLIHVINSAGAGTASYDVAIAGTSA